MPGAVALKLVLLALRWIRRGDVGLPPDEVSILMATHHSRVGSVRKSITVTDGNLERGRDPFVELSVPIGKVHAASPIVVGPGHIWPAVVVMGVHLQISVVQVAHVFIHKNDGVARS